MIKGTTSFLESSQERVFDLNYIYTPIGEVVIIEYDNKKYSLVISNVIDTFEIRGLQTLQRRLIYVTKKIIPKLNTNE